MLKPLPDLLMEAQRAVVEPECYQCGETENLRERAGKDEIGEFVRLQVCQKCIDRGWDYWGQR